MPVTNYPNGFSGGVSILGVPILNTYGGNIFWVGSTRNGASDVNASGKREKPFKTIDYAVGRCTASNGDVIMVLPGHVETVSAAAGLDLDVAGITLVGMGRGADRPQINFTTVVGADMDVDAASISMDNFLFTGGFDALTGPIDINSADFTMTNCEFRDVTGQATDCIITDANADRLLIDGWSHRGSATAGGQSAIQVTGGDDITIRNFRIYGDFVAGAIENVTTAAVRLTIDGGQNSYIQNLNSTDLAIALVATTTGNIGPNIFIRLADNAANHTECISIANDCQIFDPIMVCNLDAERGLQYNGTVSTDA